ncbi:hypothetical protein Golob_004241, partial [Gossypium lobatum]|nr:hypothetical protein [Gossypium lobatum]
MTIQEELHSKPSEMLRQKNWGEKEKLRLRSLKMRMIGLY